MTFSISLEVIFATAFILSDSLIEVKFWKAVNAFSRKSDCAEALIKNDDKKDRLM